MEQSWSLSLQAVLWRQASVSSAGMWTMYMSFFVVVCFVLGRIDAFQHCLLGLCFGFNFGRNKGFLLCFFSIIFVEMSFFLLKITFP